MLLFWNFIENKVSFSFQKRSFSTINVISKQRIISCLNLPLISEGVLHPFCNNSSISSLLSEVDPGFGWGQEILLMIRSVNSMNRVRPLLVEVRLRAQLKHF